MSQIFDPMDALLDLQQAISNGTPINFGMMGDDCFGVYEANGEDSRFLFAKIVNGEVRSIATFGRADPIDGIKCYSVNYAVSNLHRRRGLAVELVEKGIVEIKKFLIQTGLSRFYVEAIIDKTNVPSIKFAEKLFSTSGELIEEEGTGMPALQFKKLIEN